ncbi:S1C family serine protease [Cohnella faecalis]|uniref:S1C family serine protease n=1 Tax=Cohnella faecalis TaxID=2315694 RepID=UPI0026C91F49|nr:trypsin-like peptidase domain-containing protein [Cohnella faecalis]
MSLFDDDFFSTRVSRRTRNDRTSDKRPFGGSRSSSTLRVTVVSSAASALLVALLFATLSGGKDPGSASKPVLASGQSLVETSERIISASERVRPVVVSIINHMKTSEDGQQAQSDSGDLDDGELPENASLGSGVIFEKKNGNVYIITNAHVIDNAEKVEAVMVDGTRRSAKIVGMDTISDLAVLSMDDKGIDKVAEIGNSDKLRVGEMVIAIGNPLGFGDSLSQGIVSSTHRVIPVSLSQDGIYDWEQEVIQTDAAINQGNSGGALVDLNGRVVGINSMKVADMGVEGIGFAIPISDAMTIIDQLMEHGKVLRPYMGVYSMDLSAYLDNNAFDDSDGQDSGEPDSSDSADGDPKVDGEEEAAPELIVPDEVKQGIIVLEAVGPGKDAGLRFNDIITELDGNPIGSTLELRKYLYTNKKSGIL